MTSFCSRKSSHSEDALLNAHTKAACSLHLVVAWARGKSYVARQVKMSGEVAEALHRNAQSAMESLTDPTPYAPDSDMEDNSHMEAPRDESLDTVLIDELSKGASLDLVAEEELRSKRLTCHALVATTSTDVTLFVRKRTPITLAKKSLVATLMNGRLDSLNEPLFAFDDHYDAIITPETVYVLNKKAFEGMFKDSPAVLEKTSEWVDEVSSVLPFAEGSADELDVVLRRNSILRNKFLAVKGRSYLHDITPGNLRDEMSKYGFNPEELMEGDSLKVTQENAKDVLRLLNEDLFSGGFSRQHYAASAKRALD